MKGASSMTVGLSNRSSTQNRLTDYTQPRPSAMMNNFAGPSDTDNFPPSEEQMQYVSADG